MKSVSEIQIYRRNNKEKEFLHVSIAFCQNLIVSFEEKEVRRFQIEVKKAT